MESYVVDLDDFCEKNTDWERISRLKEIIPPLKLNLFTIPGLCTDSWLYRMREISWIRLYPHGYLHSTSRECENWSYQVAENYLIYLEKAGWIKGWKSPGWQSSLALLECLRDRGWWIASQKYDEKRNPFGLQAYYLDSPYKLHGHIGHLGGHNANALEYLFDELLTLQGEFLFIENLI